MNSWEEFESEALEFSAPAQRYCKFGQYLNSLGENAKYVQQSLNNPKISSRALYRALMARGMDCGNTSVEKHRRQECTCYKDNT